MEIDLHGFELWEALEEIFYHLEISNAKGIREISIIHGYHGGAILKNFIQSDNFIKKMEREGYQLKRKKSSNPGVSCFLLI